MTVETPLNNFLYVEHHSLCSRERQLQGFYGFRWLSNRYSVIEYGIEKGSDPCEMMMGGCEKYFIKTHPHLNCSAGKKRQENNKTPPVDQPGCIPRSPSTLQSISINTLFITRRRSAREKENKACFSQSRQSKVSLVRFGAFRRKKESSLL